MLKSVAPGKPKIHTLKGHHYQCVKRAVDPASGDFTTVPKPKPGQNSTAPTGGVSVNTGKVKDDAKAKRVEDAEKKAKIDRDAKAKLKAAAETERRRKAAEKAAADKAKKDLIEKLKLLKAKKDGAKPRATSVNGQTSVMRLR